MSINQHSKSEWGLFKEHPSQYYMDRIPPEQIIGMLPKSEQYAHYFWSWIWIISIPGCLALAFVKWWLLFSVLIVPSMIRNAVKTSTRDFVCNKAKQDKEFFDICFDNEIIKKK